MTYLVMYVIKKKKVAIIVGRGKDAGDIVNMFHECIWKVYL